MSPLAQNHPSKFKKCFFILNYTKPLVVAGFEQISSSICCRVMAYRRGLSSSFQQNFEPKEWGNGLGPRAGQRWPTFPKHVLFVTSPPENSRPKQKIVFFDFDYKTSWIRRGFEQLSSSIAWRVIGLQNSWNVVFAGLKGLIVFHVFFGIASVFLKQLKIILLLGYFSESCKFISIFFVLRNQFCILTFVAFSEHSVFIFDRCK